MCVLYSRITRSSTKYCVWRKMIKISLLTVCWITSGGHDFDELFTNLRKVLNTTSSRRKKNTIFPCFCHFVDFSKQFKIPRSPRSKIPFWVKCLRFILSFTSNAHTTIRLQFQDHFIALQSFILLKNASYTIIILTFVLCFSKWREESEKKRYENRK